MTTGVCVIRALALAALVCPTLASADPPRFSDGGFLFSVYYGAGIWQPDRAGLAAQVGQGEADLFAGDLKNTHTVSLRASYNIKGHASLLADLTATGWSLTDTGRGGAGFLIGSVAWHPLELVWMKKEQRPIPLDASTWFGVGYGIAGQRRGADGLVLQWGLDATYFLNRYFGVGLFFRDTFLLWANYFLDYDGRTQPGMTITLPKGAGGAFLHLGLALVFRAGE